MNESYIWEGKYQLGEWTNSILFVEQEDALFFFLQKVTCSYTNPNDSSPYPEASFLQDVF